MDSFPFLAVQSKFFLSCYHHWSSLVLNNGNETTSFLHIRDDGVQGGPLDMDVFREKCDKDGHSLGFVPHTYFSLFDLFINICTSFGITLIYKSLFSSIYI